MAYIRFVALEDDELYADLLRITLEGFGYDLTGLTDSSQEFLRLVKAASPDLLLMDIYIDEETTGKSIQTINWRIPA